MPIIKNTIIHYDFETDDSNPYTCQPIEICAVAINHRTLEIIPDSQFYSLIQIVEDKAERDKLGLGDIQQAALDVNKKTMEELRKAPSLKSVWQSFVKYCENYSTSNKKWDKPILSGFNNHRFDDIILNRIAKPQIKDAEGNPVDSAWGYGPWENSRQHIPLFHPTHNYDLMQMIIPWMESKYELNGVSMDAICDFMNYKLEGAHSADVDVERQATVMLQLMKKTREFSKKMNWKK